MIIEQLELELEGIYKPGRGQMRQQAEFMVRELDEQNRLTRAHIPLIGLLYRLADALEDSHGRGASVAMLSREYRDTWQLLTDQPLPPEADDDVEYDVTWLPEVSPEPAPDAS
jgi:hypothetical protein